MNRALLLLAIATAAVPAAAVPSYRRILVPSGSHPAVHSAAEILSRRFNIPANNIKTIAATALLFPLPRPGQILLVIAPGSPAQRKLLGEKINVLRPDGYLIVFHHGGALIYGSRPRSLLYAAGDWRLWKDKDSGTLLREPDFALRTGAYDSGRSVAEYVAELGVNVLIDRPNSAVVSLKETMPEIYQQLSPEEQRSLDEARAQAQLQNRELARQAHNADISLYAFLYGNDFSRWSPSLYRAVIKAYPSVKGTPAPQSWEKASLCPSDPMTWKIVRSYVKEFMDLSSADGLYVTFWDNYGLDCQDNRCLRNGLSHFPNQLHELVKQYSEILHPTGKPLIVRTWSSGVSHWLNTEFVHAPGYDDFGGSGEALWSRVIKEVSPDIVIQTKVYKSDCEPDPPFSPLLGTAKPHTEIAEYQIAGQTVGRFYFPASSVAYTAWTMQKAHELIGAEGGVSIFPGGTRQSDYSVFDDLLNSINLYAWRELSWNVNADLDKIWMDWAIPIYGERAAPHIVKALRLSEEAVNRTFSTLGLGSSTNSDFARTIERRETLLKYTNRYYLPEYAKHLEPTKDNIQRVIDEKTESLRKIDEMISELEQARPFLPKEQAEELATRFDWLKEFAICSRYLDESLWRYRYLRYLNSMLTTDPGQLKPLAEAEAAIQEHAKRLFLFDPSQKFNSYTKPLGQLRIQPSLGSPLPLMQELYEKSKASVKNIVGPDYRDPTEINGSP